MKMHLFGFTFILFLIKLSDGNGFSFYTHDAHDVYLFHEFLYEISKTGLVLILWPVTGKYQYMTKMKSRSKTIQNEASRVLFRPQYKITIADVWVPNFENCPAVSLLMISILIVC